MKKTLLLAIATIISISAYAQTDVPKREVRAVWLETVDKLDWPSSKTESAQKQELCEILDYFAAANFNTILFQAQARGDVAWISSIQPAMVEFTNNYSSSLPYDVAQFVIDECHKRCMECHATIIPYRLGTASRANSYKQAAKHPYKSHPELCVTYNNQLYLDPGNPATTEYLVELYRELLSKYNFDGVSFDYCRYPGSAFDDAASYKAYNPEGLPKDDWRRQNINNFISAFYDMVQETNPHVKVGAAPIGTYTNLPGYGNATAYGSYYQDACQWVKNGDCHTLYPQMYWNEKYGFTPNMATWVNNMNGRQFVVGLAAYKMVDGTNDWEASDVTDQVDKVRKQEGTCGVCFFRAKNVLPGQGTKPTELYNLLKDNQFKYPAHIPTMEYKEVTMPGSPKNVTATLSGGQYQITWEKPDNADDNPIWYYCIYRENAGKADIDDITTAVIAKTQQTSVTVPAVSSNDTFLVTAFDMNNYESNPASSSISDITADNAVTVLKTGDILEISASSVITKVTVTDIAGKTVLCLAPMTEKASIDCNSLAAGTYFTQICVDNNLEIVKKFIK